VPHLYAFCAQRWEANQQTAGSVSSVPEFILFFSPCTQQDHPLPTVISSAADRPRVRMILRSRETCLSACARQTRLRLTPFAVILRRAKDLCNLPRPRKVHVWGGHSCPPPLLLMLFSKRRHHPAEGCPIFARSVRKDGRQISGQRKTSRLSPSLSPECNINQEASSCPIFVMSSNAPVCCATQHI
jgi:hypothetical protein